MEIKVLGPGCPSCVTLERVTRQVVAEMGVDAVVEKVTDYGEILAYGVMSSPGLVVDGAVVLAGRLPTPAKLRELLESAIR